MIDREKVIRGLERCAKGNCPFSEEYKACEYTVGMYCGKKRLMMDALELLKAQEPRLITVEDFKDADAYGYIPAWCETKNDLFCECILIGALEEEGCRYWTAKPTDEQRRATPWTT